MIMTKIIKYEREAALLADAILTITSYHCIYFQAKGLCTCTYARVSILFLPNGSNGSASASLGVVH